jgi:hypothetical protein
LELLLFLGGLETEEGVVSGEVNHGISKRSFSIKPRFHPKGSPRSPTKINSTVYNAHKSLANAAHTQFWGLSIILQIFALVSSYGSCPPRIGG